MPAPHSPKTTYLCLNTCCAAPCYVCPCVHLAQNCRLPPASPPLSPPFVGAWWCWAAAGAHHQAVAFVFRNYWLEPTPAAARFPAAACFVTPHARHHNGRAAWKCGQITRRRRQLMVAHEAPGSNGACVSGSSRISVNLRHTWRGVCDVTPTCHAAVCVTARPARCTRRTRRRGASIPARSAGPAA